ncbi:MAG: double-strand break repair protein AddB [Paracoccaceae bacterium]
MMFTQAGPRVFGLPPGVDFPARLLDGLIERLGPGAPERMAQVTLFLNTARMRRRVVQLLAARGATFLPRLRLIAELADDPLLAEGARATSSLGRRLDLAVLIERLLRSDPGLAPRSALFDLADSLAGLMDEMQGEGVSPAQVAALDVAEHSAHWARAQRFLALAAQVIAADPALDAEARQRRAVERLIARWQAVPPQGPVILAGSTGSRGTTQLLMQAVARLPQGAVVLPGFDYDLPGHVWDGMEEALVHEGHPQFRLGALLRGLGLETPVPEWVAGAAPWPARNRMISLALRPAPVTDQWISEGAGLGDLRAAAQAMTLIEAPSPRQEAMAIALVLRGAVETGRRVCLITPDRDLTRRVAAALDRWGLRPDDSAGQPLPQTAPGRLLRLVAEAMGRPLSADQLLVLLKHPLAQSGPGRGLHQRLVRTLELRLRRKGPAFPDAGFLAAWAEAEGAADWGRTMAGVLDLLAAPAEGALADLVRRHRAIAEALAGGPGGLWDMEAGAEALAAIEELERDAPAQLHLAGADYAPLLAGVLARREVRSAVLADERVQILGAQEARIQGADLVVLGGLNEGSWPEAPAPDPWLNRRLRREAGLLLPERRVGLSAHDFQMAVAGPEVVLTRAHRTADAETVPARWLNRLTNLMRGLPGGHGPEALAAMQARGARVLSQVAALEAPDTVQPAGRPSPRPPVSARPRQLSITAIETLISNPFDIYARHVLRLSPLNPLRPEADHRLRGEVVHEVLERFLKSAPLPDQAEAAAELLMQITDQVLQDTVPWPVARADWRQKMGRIALPFSRAVLARDSQPVLLEQKAAVRLPGVDFTLTGKPDRIDLLPDGSVHVIDYKTGEPPAAKDMDLHRKQLHLAAVMALQGAFPRLGPRVAGQITYQSLKPGLKEVSRSLTEDDIHQVLQELEALVTAYLTRATGFTARRAALDRQPGSDFDHLARLGEWTIADPASGTDVGEEDAG